MPSLPQRRKNGTTVRDAVTVKVITYAPTVFSHCQHCEIAFGEVGIGERIRRDEAASALPPDLALDFARLSDWVRGLVERHGERVHVEVVDAASVEGVLVSLRHRVWRHPAVVIDGRAFAATSGYAAVEPEIDRAVATRAGTLGSPAATSSERPIASA